MAADKPKIHATLADLETEGKPEAFVFATKAGKRVTFPDPFEMGWEEGEEFLEDLQKRSAKLTLSKWLSEKDYELLRAEGLSVRKLGILLEMVLSHYQGAVGDSGEGDASAN